jgi:hypothetical protein
MAAFPTRQTGLKISRNKLAQLFTQWLQKSVAYMKRINHGDKGNNYLGALGAATTRESTTTPGADDIAATTYDAETSQDKINSFKRKRPLYLGMAASTRLKPAICTV